MLIAAGLAVLALAGAAGWLRRRYVAVRVTGGSMHPALRPGDRVLARRTRPGAVRTGDVVVIARPSSPGAEEAAWLVKRVAAMPGDRVPPDSLPAGLAVSGRVPAGKVIVLGDARDNSRDSRHYGYLDAATILGVVRMRGRSGTGVAGSA